MSITLLNYKNYFKRTGNDGFQPKDHITRFMRPCLSSDSHILCGCFLFFFFASYTLCDWGFVLISCCGKIICKTKTVLGKIENQIVILKEIMEFGITCSLSSFVYDILCC